jgi:hypothetical protein
MTPIPAHGERSEADSLAREISIQAELLALNVALGGGGAEQSTEALRALSRELGWANSGLRVTRGGLART